VKAGAPLGAEGEEGINGVCGEMGSGMKNYRGKEGIKPLAFSRKARIDDHGNRLEWKKKRIGRADRGQERKAVGFSQS